MACTTETLFVIRRGERYLGGCRHPNCKGWLDSIHNPCIRRWAKKALAERYVARLEGKPDYPSGPVVTGLVVEEYPVYLVGVSPKGRE